ncbi:MAG: hypothetical protein JNL21_14925 [Myxococcales bacterium]|nr:hypothetical protein [Myxococcales bacterium]
MRALGLVVLLSGMGLFACGDDSTTGGSGGGGTGGLGSGGGGDVPFSDLPGRIRFVNFVSDGTKGVDLDLYWGNTQAESELVGTVAYGEITEYLTPRRPGGSAAALLDPDETVYFMVRKGDMAATPSAFLVRQEETFDASTTLTIGLASKENVFGDDLVVESTPILEHVLPVPGAADAHVYAWDGPFQRIAGGDFVEVAAEGICGPELVSATGNIGEAAVLAPTATGLFLADANTTCATGSAPAAGGLAAGKSYVLLGKADTFEVSARQAVLLELSVGD